MENVDRTQEYRWTDTSIVRPWLPATVVSGTKHQLATQFIGHGYNYCTYRTRVAKDITGKYLGYLDLKTSG